MNPFNPPQSVVSDPPTPGKPYKGLFLGLLVDIGGSMVLGVVLFIAYLALAAPPGVNFETDSAQLSESFRASAFADLGMFFGCLLSVAGGYVCARIAKPSSMRLCWLMAAISCGSGFLLSFDDYSIGMNLLLAVATFASVTVGYYLGWRHVAAAENRMQG